MSSIIEFPKQDLLEDLPVYDKTVIIPFEKKEDNIEPETQDNYEVFKTLMQDREPTGKKPVSLMNFATYCMLTSYSNTDLRVVSIGVTNDGNYRLHCTDAVGNMVAFEIPGWEAYYE